MLDTPFAFWQYGTQARLPTRAGDATATDQQLFDFIDRIAGWTFYSERARGFLPYYFQATSSSTGRTSRASTRWLKGLLRYREAGRPGRRAGRDRAAARHRRDARHRQLGEEPSAAACCSSTARTTRGARRSSSRAPAPRDSHWYTVPAGNHGASSRPAEPSSGRRRRDPADLDGRAADRAAKACTAERCDPGAAGTVCARLAGSSSAWRHALTGLVDPGLHGA